MNTREIILPALAVALLLQELEQLQRKKVVHRMAVVHPILVKKTFSEPKAITCFKKGLNTQPINDLALPPQAARFCQKEYPENQKVALAAPAKFDLSK